MSRMDEDQKKRVEDEESVIFHRKLPYKEHVKNDKTCKLCNHSREKKSDIHDVHCPTYCDINGKEISDVDLFCDDFELKI
jgi:hypothetical protein